jgi:hypothetical protein
VDVYADGRKVERHLTTRAQLKLPRQVVMERPQAEFGAPPPRLMLEDGCNPDVALDSCDGGGGGGGGTYTPPPPPPPAVMLGSLMTLEACDYYCVVPANDNLELEFKTWMRGVEQKVKWYTVSPNATFLGKDLQIRNERPYGAETVHIQVWESDYGQDDRWITYDMRGDEGSTNWLGGGRLRCSYSTPHWVWPDYPSFGVKIIEAPSVLCPPGFWAGEINASFWLRTGETGTELPPEDIEEGSPEVAAQAPDCRPENRPRLRITARAYCDGDVPAEPRLTRIRNAIKRVRDMGGICEQLANIADSVLAGNRLRVYSKDLYPGFTAAFGKRGDRGKGWMAISTKMTDEHYDADHRWVSGGQVRYLPRSIAHEADHLMGNWHIFINGVEQKMRTPNTLQCMGFPSSS